jgi:Cdc6-like AAA superfamily ATPase
MALPSYEVSFRILAQAATKERADQIVDTLATSLTALQSETNSFILKRPLIGKQRLQRDILQRTNTTLVPGWANWQYFSVDELATVWHMPNKQLSTIKNIAWGKNLLGEPPENLPTYTHTAEAERVNLNLFARTEFKNQEQIFGIRKLDRRRHMYVIGKSGTGKSTLLANMIINDLKHNEGLAVVDPHDDEEYSSTPFQSSHRADRPPPSLRCVSSH